MIVKATLVKRKTDDGLWEVNDDVPIGKEYLVNPNWIRKITAYNLLKRVYHKRDMILCDNDEWFPVELLKIEE